ncbi:MAG: T9SS type A sorting domain-containing protein [Bacteroidota bacterium]
MRKLLIVFSLFTTFCFSQEWEAVGGGVTSFGQIRDIWVDTLTDEIYVSGDFTSIGGVPSGGVAKWDGTEWTDLCPDCFNHQIYSVLKFHDKLHISGSFLLPGPTVTHFAKLTDTGWESIADTDDGGRLQVLGDSLYLLNTGDTVDGMYLPDIALYDGENILPPFQGNDFFDDPFFQEISQLIKYGGITILGGNFSVDSLNEIVWYDNGYWRPLGVGIPGDANIEQMIVYKDILYLGGNIHDEDGNPSDYLIAWNGREFFNPFPDVQFTYNVRDFQIINDELYIVSLYNYVGDPTTYFFAKFDGENFCSFGGSFPSINDLTSSPPKHIRELNGELYVVSSEVLFNDTVNRLAHWLGEEMDTCIYSPVSSVKEQEMSADSFHLYPNPSSDVFEITWSSNYLNKQCFVLYDHSGKVVLEKETTNKLGQSTLCLDISKLTPGVYILDAGQRRYKVVKL